MVPFPQQVGNLLDGRRDQVARSGRDQNLVNSGESDRFWKVGYLGVGWGWVKILLDVGVNLIKGIDRAGGRGRAALIGGGQ